MPSAPLPSGSASLLSHVLAACIGLVALGLSGCISAEPTATPTDSGPSEQSPGAVDVEARAAALASAETFNPSRYPVRQPTRSASIEHNVPSQLMRLRADEGITETVEGFRVQVYSATSKQLAEEFRERVQSWFQKAQSDAPAGLFPSDQPPVIIQYSQPYYRVRIGAFTQRGSAREALEFIRTEYTDAFIARSTVTITR